MNWSSFKNERRNDKYFLIENCKEWKDTGSYRYIRIPKERHQQHSAQRYESIELRSRKPRSGRNP
jgi:hypothetical protein